MSPNSVNDLASSFVQMAKAFEELPQVLAEKAELQRELSNKVATIQRLELKLIDRSNEIDRLHASLRTEEAKRSDAETMFLESDDAKSTLERMLESLGKDIASALQAVRPVAKPVVEHTKPAPVTGVETNPTSHSTPDQSSIGDQISQSINQSGELSGQSELPPSADTTTPHDAASPSPVITSDVGFSQMEGYDDKPGKSEVNPTPIEPSGHTEASSTGQSTDGNMSSETIERPFVATSAPDASSSSDATTDKPYAGKLYINVPGFMTLAEWLNGGGTEENYNYRNSVHRGAF